MKKFSRTSRRGRNNKVLFFATAFLLCGCSLFGAQETVDSPSLEELRESVSRAQERVQAYWTVAENRWGAPCNIIEKPRSLLLVESSMERYLCAKIYDAMVERGIIEQDMPDAFFGQWQASEGGVSLIKCSAIMRVGQSERVRSFVAPIYNERENFCILNADGKCYKAFFTKGISGREQALIEETIAFYPAGVSSALVLVMADRLLADNTTVAVQVNRHDIERMAVRLSPNAVDDFVRSMTYAEIGVIKDKLEEKC